MRSTPWIVGCAVAIAVGEVFMAKVRLFRVPELLAASFVLAASSLLWTGGVAIAIAFWWGHGLVVAAVPALAPTRRAPPATSLPTPPAAPRLPSG